MKGPAGYGRYDVEPQLIGCPWAKTDMTPCLARDGALCLADPPNRVCVGCGHNPRFLIADLAKDYEPAREVPGGIDPEREADWFRDLVHQATDPLATANLAILPEPAREQLYTALARVTTLAAELRHQAVTAAERVEPRLLASAKTDITAMRVALDEAQAVLDSAVIPAEPA